MAMNIKKIIAIFLIGLIVLILVACVNEPPVRSTKITPQAVEGQLIPPPRIENSPTMKSIWEKGYFKYGAPMGLPYATVAGVVREFRGIVPDIARKYANQMGFPALSQFQRWTLMPADLADGTVDAIIGGPISRPEFQEFAFIEIGERGHCLIIKKGDDRFNTLLDIEQPDLSIAVIKGSDAEYLIGRDFPRVRIESIAEEDSESIFKAVKEGTADGAIVYSRIAPLIIHHNSDLDAFPDDCIEYPILPVPWGISLRQNDVEFIKYASDLADQLIASGWIQSRIDTWSEIDRLESITPFLVNSPTN